ncbi:hypothetical protein NE865_12599 [Phthorimaea operculella]|nr:hypothetical protein NE865_12599 [Phthorimaea operculella]
MSDNEENQLPQEDAEFVEPPKKRKRRIVKTRRQSNADEEEVEQPQPTTSTSKEFELLFKLINKQNQLIEKKLAKLEKEIKKTSEAQKTLVATERAENDTPKESTPVPQEGGTLDKRIVYSITNLNQEKPKFGGHNYKTKAGVKIHPVTFLEDLTAYLKKIPAQGRELDIVQECLVDQARNWSRIYKDRWRTFEDFKRDFLETYWSEVEQNKVRRDIVSNRWNKSETPTMLEHFLKLAGQVNLLQFTIPEKQLISDIMRHYPKNVQQLWALSRNETLLAATEFLRSMDNINAEENAHAKPSSSEGSKSSALVGAHQDEPFKRHFPKYNKEWRKPQDSHNKPRDSSGSGAVKAPTATASAAVIEVENGNKSDSGNC